MHIQAAKPPAGTRNDAQQNMSGEHPGGASSHRVRFRQEDARGNLLAGLPVTNLYDKYNEGSKKRSLRKLDSARGSNSNRSPSLGRSAVKNQSYYSGSQYSDSVDTEKNGGAFRFGGSREARGYGDSVRKWIDKNQNEKMVQKRI